MNGADGADGVGQAESTRRRVQECLNDDVVAFESSSVCSAPHSIVDPQSFHVSLSCVMPEVILQEMCKPVQADGRAEGPACFMGLLPEIAHAWVAVDTKLFLWNYNTKLNSNRDELYVYEDLQQVVISAALVPPRPGVLIDEIKMVLVLCTATEVLLVGVCYSGTYGTDVHDIMLAPTQLSVSSDGVHMGCVVGLPNGRIFLGGRDGCVYEIAYQHQDGWFTSRCRKINHSQSMLVSALPSFLSLSRDVGVVDMAVDNDRRLVLALTRQSTIQVWFVGKDGTETRLSCSLNRAGKAAAQRHYLSHPLELVRIHVVPERHSSSVQAVAVSSLGHRVYLGYTFSYALLSGGAQGVRPPSSVSVVGVRAPPDNTPLSVANERVSVNSSAFCEGLHVVGMGTAGPANDQLLCISPDPSVSDGNALSAQGTLNEVVRVVDGNEERANVATLGWGQLWDIREESNAGPPHWSTEPSQAAPKGLSRELYELGVAPSSLQPASLASPQSVSLASRAPPSFVCLSFAGVRRVVHVPVVRQLQQQLQQGNWAPEAAMRFFQKHGSAQVCAMCIHLATKHAAAGPAPDPALFCAALQLCNKMGGKLQTPTPPPQFGQPPVQFSSLHNGIYLEIARTLSPVWHHSVCRVGKGGNVVLAVSRETLLAVTQRLQQVLGVLPSLIGVPKAQPPNIHSRLLSTIRDFPVVAEGASLQGVYALATRALEFLRLLHHVTSRSNLSRLASSLALSPLTPVPESGSARTGGAGAISAASVVQALSSVGFEEVCAGERGREVGRLLALALLRDCGDDLEAVSFLSDTLQRECGSFFGAQDRVIHTTRRLLETELAKGGAMGDSPARERACVEAVRLLLSPPTLAQLAHDLLPPPSSSPVVVPRPPPYIAEFCAALCRLGHHHLVPSAALACARAVDPEGLADHLFVEHDQPTPSANQHAASMATPQRSTHSPTERLAARRECYDCVLRAVEELEAVVRPQVPIAPAASHGQRQWNGLMAAAVGSDDRVFLAYFYSFLLVPHRNDLLTSMKGPLVESFLQNKQRHDLLWQFYLHNNRAEDAARILEGLAELEGPPTAEQALTGWPKNLEDRIMYLSYAAMYLGDGKGSDTDLLQHIVDRKEVAELQFQVKKDLESRVLLARDVHDDAPPHNADLDVLDHHLLDISQLYNKYARPHRLYETSLAILRCAQHSDPDLPKQLWRKLITEAGTSPGGWRGLQLRGRVKKWCLQFYPSPVVFPLDFVLSVIFDLEAESPDQWRTNVERGETAWAALEMAAGGVPLQDLVALYARTILPRVGQSESRTLVLYMLVELLGAWRDEDEAAMCAATQADLATLATAIQHAAPLAPDLASAHQAYTARFWDATAGIAAVHAEPVSAFPRGGGAQALPPFMQMPASRSQLAFGRSQRSRVV